ncbi:unnamed protein product [Arabidopsis thaliana]|uniref:RING-type E3 ubiquitin transferase n=1 Tax=Arabidopsis thaliana TaxID=3702 RepID=A0A7G2EA01_ARATH|nr:unnamed protein product [Arabidopsis thaliana]
MWLPKANGAKKETGSGSVAVAIDKDKGSQHALKWTIDNLASRGQTISLIHVLCRSHSSSDLEEGTPQQKQQMEKIAKDLFVSFHCYCSRKEINCRDILLEDADKVRAITEYVSSSAIENLVVGSASRNGFMRRFKTDLPTTVSKSAPDFCNVYVISKGKIASVRNASRPAPYQNSMQQCEIDNHHPHTPDKAPKYHDHPNSAGSTPPRPRKSVEADRSPLVKRKPYGDFYDSDSDLSFISPSSHRDSDISFISSGRPSVERSSFSLDFPESARTSRMSTSSEQSIGSNRLGIKFSDPGFLNESSTFSEESGRTSSYSSQSLDDVEAEMKRLRLELKQTMDMYSTACKEALSARQQATELQKLRTEEERRLEEAKSSEEAAMSIVEKERAKAKAALEAAEAAKRLAEVESKRRLTAEMKTMKESDSFSRGFVRYRKYTVEEIEEATSNFAESQKVGEGGYGPVFRGFLDHTSVAVKVLRPDAAQGRSQFQKEVKKKSFFVSDFIQERNTPPITWQLRFRIAAEIATGLLFLHQTKPEPIVHRDLKPGNVLLDYNYVSKISDVGLARLVPAVAENVTQYRVTSAAGTFCYIDPEYQQTGMLGVKSDVYSLGIMLLQILTAKQPMGLAYYVEQAIEEGTLKDMLDPAVPDWPIEEALSLAKLSLQCAELRRKDRPDLGKEILPELNRLREIGEESLESVFYAGNQGKSPNTSQVSIPESPAAESQSYSLFFSPRRVTLFPAYHSGRVTVSASLQHGDSNFSSNSSQTNQEAQNSIAGFLRRDTGLSEADSDFISSNCPKYTRMIVEGVRDLEEWNSWKGSGESERVEEGLGFKEKVIYMVKQKGDGGKVAFLESLGLSLSSAMYLAHYVSSESLPILLDKVKYLKEIFFSGSDEKGLVGKYARRMMLYLSIPIDEDVQQTLSFFEKVFCIEARRGGLDMLGSVDASFRFLLESFPRLLLLSEENDMKPMVEFLESIGIPKYCLGKVSVVNKDSGKLLLKYPWILSPSIQENYSHIVSFFYSESVLKMDIDHAIRRWPLLLGCSASNMEMMVKEFDKLGVRDKRMGKVIPKMPQLLLCKPQEFLKVVCFLEDLGFQKEIVGQILCRCPEIFGCSIEKTLQKKLIFLTRFGVSTTHFPRIIKKYPEFLIYDADKTVLPRLKYLMEIGISEREIAFMIRKFSPILGYSIDKVLRPKFEFLVNSMEKPVREVIEYPRYFSYSLEKRIKPRFRVLKGRNIECTLQEMLGKNDEEFAADFLGLGELQTHSEIS